MTRHQRGEKSTAQTSPLPAGEALHPTGDRAGETSRGEAST